MPVKKKKKLSKVKYRKIEIKVSNRQKILLDRFCKIHKTTTKRLVKKALKEFLERHASNPENDDYISPNQLKLFEEEVVDYRDNTETTPASVAQVQEDFGGLFSILNPTK